MLLVAARRGPRVSGVSFSPARFQHVIVCGAPPTARERAGCWRSAKPWETRIASPQGFLSRARKRWGRRWQIVLRQATPTAPSDRPITAGVGEGLADRDPGPRINGES